MRHVTRTVLLIFLFFFPLPARATVSELWHRHFPPVAGGQNQYAFDVAVDPTSGAVVVVGNFDGTLNLGGGDLVSQGNSDIYVARFGPGGIHQWSKRFGDTASQSISDVVVDDAGSIFVTGSNAGTVSFGGSNLTTAGSNDIFVARLNADGAHVFSFLKGSTSSEVGSDLAIDGAGGLYVVGEFQGTVNFGGSALVSAGGSDIFLAKYSTANGTHTWSKRFGDASNQYGMSVATDASNNVVISGYYSGVVDFGPGNLTSAGGQDVYLAKFNSAGTAQWAKRFGDASSQYGYAVDVGSAGQIAIGGYFSGTLNFGGSNLVSAGGDDAFLAVFNSAGTHTASRRIGDPSAQRVYSLVFGPSDALYAVGVATGSPDFGAGTVLPATGTVFAAHYTSNLGFVWAVRLGDDANARTLTDVDTDTEGNPVTCGYFRGSMTFLDGPIQSAGLYEIFIAKFGALVAEPDIVSVKDVRNDQGRAVRIRFTKSGQDHEQAVPPVIHYEAYRLNMTVPTAYAGRALAGPSWEFVGSVPAHAESEYRLTVPTLADSTTDLGMYRTTFIIRAATDIPSLYFDSPTDSGYSVDNLAPAVPQGIVLAGGMLSWADPPEPDFDYFSVFGSFSTRFDGTAKLLTNTTRAYYRVSGYHYYFVTATDFSGNRSDAGTTRPTTGTEPHAYALSVNAYPNPFNPGTTIRYEVPSRGRVRVEIFDARGALVTTLVDATRDAGSYSVPWDGLDGRQAPAGSGVYFARVELKGETRTKKIVLVK